jgi:hypothetical protein
MSAAAIERPLRILPKGSLSNGRDHADSVEFRWPLIENFSEKYTAECRLIRLNRLHRTRWLSKDQEHPKPHQDPNPSKVIGASIDVDPPRMVRPLASGEATRLYRRDQIPTTEALIAK